MLDEKMKRELSWSCPDSLTEYNNVKPSIIRYCSSLKPWENAWAADSDEFWFYARSSVFYEILLSRLTTIKALKEKK